MCCATVGHNLQNNRLVKNKFSNVNIVCVCKVCIHPQSMCTCCAKNILLTISSSFTKLSSCSTTLRLDLLSSIQRNRNIKPYTGPSNDFCKSYISSTCTPFTPKSSSSNVNKPNNRKYLSILIILKYTR